MSDEIETKTGNKKKSGWFASGGVLTSFFAFLGASCCVLPFILVNLGISTTIVGKLGFFVRYQSIFQWLTLGLLGAATFFAFRYGRPRMRVIILLVIGFIFAGMAYLLPSYEKEILEWLNLR
ncbi:hypothetical protein [Hirschia baltica]|uniref:Mercuric transport protein MerT n=1 Tax=Hirschia baltica (strain ATCC 49814 / DSM 5838 / IFAM 1418) TaxID=582402 RepID=C6XP99_HIRBI|nr:hypothetical protein [Hirschia baltica]ACT58385.1 hypothetical protein Hbal_0686 [Hirschia baltica ATCC 49814]